MILLLDCFFLYPTDSLVSLKLNPKGTREVLRKRMKTFEKMRILTANKIDMIKQFYKYIVVIDFEATCEETQTKDFVCVVVK